MLSRSTLTLTLSHSQRGFTLLEVLIAIGITALIGIGTSQLMTGTITAQNITQQNSERFEKLQRTVLILTRDLTQINSRSIRDEYGDFQPALTNRDEVYKIQLTRSGWRNPMADQRSDQQRVAYELVDGELLRHYWRVLDRAQDSESVIQTLLTDIEELTIRFMNDSGTWVETWPPEQVDSSNDSRAADRVLAKAIEVTIDHRYFGEIKRLVDLPQFVDIASTDDDDDGSGDNKQSGEQSTGNSSNESNGEASDGG